MHAHTPSIDWWMDGWMDGWIDWLIGCMIDWLIDWLILMHLISRVWFLPEFAYLSMLFILDVDYTASTRMTFDDNADSDSTNTMTMMTMTMLCYLFCSWPAWRQNWYQAHHWYDAGKNIKTSDQINPVLPSSHHIYDTRNLYWIRMTLTFNVIGTFANECTPR